MAAAESISGEKIAFNPFYFQDFGRIRRVIRKGARNGFYPRGADRMPMEYLVSHEWAHLVAAFLRHHDEGKWRRIVHLFAQDKADADSSFDPAKATQISIMSEAGIAEAFAEAFSALRLQSESDRPAVVNRLALVLRG
jgi:hypothetical protein